ncbi:hypothetical protein IF1G_02183 [Cordyceps javanica]|uniref:Uncharacterized protein n=1 Tax=Cordyceps javanica TaxID=43265 RepID=A0A545VE33_9HYPO|nr:hypothetical protein IF1G_02183 [Cordyceps javanica]
MSTTLDKVGLIKEVEAEVRLLNSRHFPDDLYERNAPLYLARVLGLVELPATLDQLYKHETDNSFSYDTDGQDPEE